MSPDQHGTRTPAAAGPVLRIVKGDLDDHGLAALVTVVAARASAGGPAGQSSPSVWSAPAERLRRPLRVGAGGWRASVAPR